MKVRLKDVAARAGVAVNTASTILNRRPNSWASKQTEERVFRAAEDLGYKPNRAAICLRFGKFNSIALLIPDLHNPFFTCFADLLESEVEKRGYDLIIETWRNDLDRERHCLSDIVDRQVDGVVSFLSDTLPHRTFLADLFQKGRPFVVMSSTGGPPLPVDSVLTDFSQGLSDAIEALYQLGHRQFAFLCALAKGQDDGQRTLLFQQLLKARGIEEDSFDFIRCDPTIEAAKLAATQLFRRKKALPVTALIALNDLSAIAAARAAAECGLRIPRDLSLVGVDNIPLTQFLPVSLSTVAQSIDAIAKKAAGLLIDRIENPGKPMVEQAIFPTQFLPRESIGPNGWGGES